MVYEEKDIYTEEPPNMIYVTTPSTIKVAVIYLYSSTTPKKADGWAHDWNEAINIAIKETYLSNSDVPYITDFPQLYVGLSVEEYFKKYISKTWKWNYYEYYVPRLVEENVMAQQAIQLWREEYPTESEQTLSTNDIIYFIINGLSSLSHINQGSIVTNGIGTGVLFDPTRPFINIEGFRYLLAHEITHLFGADDHYSHWEQARGLSDPPEFLAEPITNCLMGDGYPPFGISYNLNEMPYLDPYILTNEVNWNYLLKQNFDRPYNFSSRYSVAHFYVNLSDTIEYSGSEVDLNGIKQITGDRGVVSYWGLNNLIAYYAISRAGYIPNDGQLIFDIDRDIRVTLYPLEEPPPPPIQYTLTLQSLGSGSTIPASGTYLYDEGAIIEVTAYPSSNWEFYMWNINGSYYYGNPISMHITSDLFLTANFREIFPPPPPQNGLGFLALIPIALYLISRLKKS